jgi:DNA-binding HxlR family transcriptional regulator
MLQVTGSARKSNGKGRYHGGVSAQPDPPPVTALAAALDRVGDRWSLLLVESLLDGSHRFNDLLELLPGLAPNILSDRIRRLERGGILRAVPYSRHPVRMEYSLTADGHDLAGALRLLADWGGRRAGGGAEGHDALHHAACGTQLEARWYCPTCTSAIADDETGDVPVV